MSFLFAGAGGASARDRKGSGDKGFPVQFKILGLQVFVYAVVMFLNTVRDSQAKSFKQPIKNAKKIEKFKNPMSPEFFVSHAKAVPAKRNKKGYGDEEDKAKTND